jgi:VIT1/CCC1 family predicted Fe2+/Mn2+ transporter
MSDLLRITSWATEHWGRASGREADDLPAGLVVILGSNETGKSSIAAAIAWLLAGPGTEADIERFGNPGSQINARLTARLGDEPLTIEATVKIPQASTRRTVRENFRADLAGVPIDRPTLTTKLGGITLDALRGTYWVDAEQVPAPRSVNAEEELTARVVFGNVDPFGIANELEEAGHRQIGRSRGQAAAGSARELADAATELRGRIKMATGARETWQVAQDARTQAIDEENAARSNMADCADRVSTIESALSAISEHLRLKSAEELLRDTASATENDQRLAHDRIQIQSVIDDLLETRSKHRGALEKVTNAEDSVGDWAEFALEIDSTDATIQNLLDAEAKIRTRRDDRDGAGATLDGLRTSDDAGSDRGDTRIITAAIGTAVGLAIAAAATAIAQEPVAAVALGITAALALAFSIRTAGPNRRETTGSPVELASSELAKAEGKLGRSIIDRNELLIGARIPAESIPEGNDQLVSRLRGVANLKSARRNQETFLRHLNDLDTDLLSHFPEGTRSGDAGGILTAAVSRVDDHEKASTAVNVARMSLRETLGGVNTPAGELLDSYSRPALTNMLNSETERRPDLEDALATSTRKMDLAGVDLAQAEDEADLQTPLLQLEALGATIREKVVDGIANRLAAAVLTDSATSYLGDNSPELLRRANELATNISGRQWEIRLDPHSESLRVLSTNGDHPEGRLSTGGRSLLNLTLRLASISIQTDSVPVRLPLFLDDALVHLDPQRKRAAFDTLADFSKRHQVFYFTCDNVDADSAVAVGGHLIEL